LEDENGSYVIIKSEKDYKKQYIKTGIETEEYYEITEGLQDGQSIVLPTAEIEKRINETK